MASRVLYSAAIVLIFSVAAQADVFMDDFNIDSSANWNVNKSSSDTSVTFAFDYSTIGVPPSPNGDGSTFGLRMAANMNMPGAYEAVTLSPVGMHYSGVYVLKFDMWINANGPFPEGGTGSTEFLTAGIGYDDATVNLGDVSGSGGWFAVTGEGGTARDYRAYKDSLEQFAESGQFFAGISSVDGGAHNHYDSYYADFGGIIVDDAVPYQHEVYPDQTGTTEVGSAGFAWYEVVITVDETAGTALWEIDGLPIAELDANIGFSFPLAGNISIGYMDVITSVSDNEDVSFGLIDNLMVWPDPWADVRAHSPSPANNSELILADTNLTWEDPIYVEPVAYDVYLSAVDPNLYEADKVVDHELVNSYEPSGETELDPNTLYFWRVDVYDPNDGGTPFVREGTLWNFKTAPPEPFIIGQPELVVTVDAGQTAELSISAINAEGYTWYKIAEPEDEVVPDQELATLSIENAGEDDEGYYYCSIAEGVNSDVGRILIRRKMAHWKFDGTLEDEVDSANDGTSLGTINYAYDGGVDGDAVKIAEPDKFVLIDNAMGLFNEVSISMWFYAPGSALGWASVLLVPQESGERGSISITTIYSALNVEVLGSGVGNTLGTLAANVWTHLVFVYKPQAREAVIYINGEPIATLTVTNQDVLPNLTALGIGARNRYNTIDMFDDGLFDDIRIYNFGLTPLNVASLYTGFMTGENICLDPPDFDLNEDCLFDIEDFAEVAATWLECNLVPDCIDPQMP